MAKNKFDISNLKRANMVQKKVIPRIVAERARRFFELSFKNEGFTDKSLKKWPKRKRETRETRDEKVLYIRGYLKRSIRRTKMTPREVRIASVGISYANYHNNGTRKHPVRRFIGNSRVLEKGIQKIIERELKKAATKK